MRLHLPNQTHLSFLEAKAMLADLQTLGRRDEGQPHWEAGDVKLDRHGGVRMNSYNRPSLENGKAKVNY